MDFQEKKIAGDGHVAIHEWSPVDESGHHKNSDEIQGDIRESRHSMDVILDALEGRIHPRSMIDRFLDTFQKPENQKKVSETLNSVGSSIARSFQRNPMPAMLLTVATAWMIWENQKTPKENEPQYQEGESKTGEFKEKARETFGAQKEMLRSTEEKIRQRAGDQGEQIRGRSQEARERAMDLRDKASDRFRSGAGTTDRLVHENPLITGAIAMVAGLVAGALLPETEKEKDTFGEKSRETMQTAKDTEKGVLDSASRGINEGKDIPESRGPDTTQPKDLNLKLSEPDVSPLDLSQSEIEKQRKISEGNEPGNV